MKLPGSLLVFKTHKILYESLVEFNKPNIRPRLLSGRHGDNLRRVGTTFIVTNVEWSLDVSLLLVVTSGEVAWLLVMKSD